MTGPAEDEGSENKRVRGRVRSPKGKGGGEGRRVKFQEAFPVQEMHRGDREKERTSHTNVPLGWAVLDSGAAKSLSLQQNLHLCWLRLARNVVAMQEMMERLRPWKRSTTFVESENK